jgi:hypothetical protein
MVTPVSFSPFRFLLVVGFPLMFLPPFAGQRAALGIKAKRLINECRAEALRDEGWHEVRLLRYVGERVSPENTLMLAA